MELRDLSKSYGKRPAVQSVSLRIPPGQIVGLLGPNGAGKSTTIAMLTGLLSPSAGQILWGGRSIFLQMPAWRKALGVVLEDLSLFEYLGVREHLHLMGRLSGMDRAETERRTGELLEFFDLGDHYDTLAVEASHGTRKKLAFALGLIHAPRVLLLDEALNGIDAVTVSRIRALLRRCAERGATIILSSHVLDSAQALIDRCVIIDKGRIVIDLPMEAVRASGKSLEEVYVETLRSPLRRAPQLAWMG